ncbi:MAG: hypothetical protein RL291_1931, partial [Pseudomonadota bacterium]
MLETTIRAIERIAGLLLLAVALLTFTIVILRKGFSTDIPDWYDFSRLMQGMAIFWGIAAACYRGGHIVVDLVWDMAGPRSKRAIDIIANVFLVAFIASFAYYAMVAAIEMRGKNLLTSDLRIPQWGFYFTAALGIVAAALMGVVRAFRIDRDHRNEAQAAGRAIGIAFPVVGAGVFTLATAVAVRATATSNALIAVAGFVVMFLLMLVRVPIGVAMGIIGVLGYGLKSG